MSAKWFAVAGDAADLVERRHERRRPGLRRGLERREVQLAQALLGRVDRVVVAPGLRAAVGDPVLGRGCHPVGLRVVLALEALDAGGGERGAEERILAGALDDAAPARVARDVDHRRERPVDAGRARLAGRDGRRALGVLRVPARRLGERHREHGAVAVDDVEAIQQRDLQAGLLHRHPLGVVRVLGAPRVERRAQPALADHPDLVVAELAGRVVGVELLELPELLLERHLRQPAVDLRLDLGVRILRDGLLRGPLRRDSGGRQGDEGDHRGGDQPPRWASDCRQQGALGVAHGTLLRSAVPRLTPERRGLETRGSATGRLFARIGARHVKLRVSTDVLRPESG